MSISREECVEVASKLLGQSAFIGLCTKGHLDLKQHAILLEVLIEQIDACANYEVNRDALEEIWGFLFPTELHLRKDYSMDIEKKLIINSIRGVINECLEYAPSEEEEVKYILEQIRKRQEIANILLTRGSDFWVWFIFDEFPLPFPPSQAIEKEKEFLRDTFNVDCHSKVPREEVEKYRKKLLNDLEELNKKELKVAKGLVALSLSISCSDRYEEKKNPLFLLKKSLEDRIEKK